MMTALAREKEKTIAEPRYWPLKMRAIFRAGARCYRHGRMHFGGIISDISYAAFRHRLCRRRRQARVSMYALRIAEKIRHAQHNSRDIIISMSLATHTPLSAEGRDGLKTQLLSVMITMDTPLPRVDTDVTGRRQGIVYSPPLVTLLPMRSGLD